MKRTKSVMFLKIKLRTRIGTLWRSPIYKSYSRLSVWVAKIESVRRLWSALAGYPSNTVSHWAPSWCPEELLAQRQTDNVHWCDSPCIMPSSVSWTATVIRPLYHRFWFTGISRGWFIRRTRQGLGVRRIYTVYAARTIHELFHIWLLVSTFVPRYSKIRPRKNKEQNSGKNHVKEWRSSNWVREKKLFEDETA